MKSEEILTHSQKVALKGEVAYAVSTSFHDADIKCRIYLFLKKVDDNLKPFIIEAFKEAVTFDEEIINRIYLEVLAGKTPVWLWIEKVITDLKEYSKAISLESLESKLSINKGKEKKNLVESAFISFGRTLIIAFPTCANKLFEAILNDDGLSFLHTSCFYLKQECMEAISTHKELQGDIEIPEELMEIAFNPNNLLNPKAEMETTEELNKNPLKNRKPLREKSQPIKKETIIIEGSISHAELSEFLSQKISELFQNRSSESERQPSNNIKYVVQKVFNDSNIKTDIRTCDTKEEAAQFIQQIKQAYPELENTCSFIIENRKIV